MIDRIPVSYLTPEAETLLDRLRHEGILAHRPLLDGRLTPGHYPPPSVIPAQRPRLVVPPWPPVLKPR